MRRPRSTRAVEPWGSGGHIWKPLTSCICQTTLTLSETDRLKLSGGSLVKTFVDNTRVGTLIVATIYLQLIQNRYTFRSFTVLQCSHQHCVQPVASEVEVVGYL